MDGEVTGASVLHFCADHFAREFGTIAIATQVAEVNVVQVGVHDRLQRFGGGFVGQMAMPTGDPLFQTPGAARIVLQHFQIVIGFEDEDVGSADAFANETRGVTEIRQETDFMSAGVQHEADRVIGVVRDRESIDADVADVERATGGEQVTNFQPHLQLKFHRFAREAVAVNGNFQLRAQTGEALDMIGVFVREQNAVEVFWGAANGSKAFADLAAGKAGVDQQPGFAGFEIGAIAAGTAA
jgi:hypothetical protein